MGTRIYRQTLQIECQNFQWSTMAVVSRYVFKKHTHTSFVNLFLSSCFWIERKKNIRFVSDGLSQPVRVWHAQLEIHMHPPFNLFLILQHSNALNLFSFFLSVLGGAIQTILFLPSPPPFSFPPFLPIFCRFLWVVQQNKSVIPSYYSSQFFLDSFFFPACFNHCCVLQQRSQSFFFHPHPFCQIFYSAFMNFEVHHLLFVFFLF